MPIKIKGQIRKNIEQCQARGAWGTDRLGLRRLGCVRVRAAFGDGELCVCPPDDQFGRPRLGRAFLFLSFFFADVLVASD